MRLLNTSSLRLKEFNDGDKIPGYAILSHTWGKEEVTFQDMMHNEHDSLAKQKAGYKKVDAACSKARSDGFRWIWIDTCCIDKSSTAELSEALNSMWRWYKNSERCYAYLEDVPDGVDFNDLRSPFATSRWFTRGWTLQELIAPRRIHFLSNIWSDIVVKSECIETLSKMTGVQRGALEGDNVAHYSIAQKMSWASRRSTTRAEDIAYCLLGLFDVNMPLLYGEGGMKAFERLQETLLKDSDDQTILAWIPSLENSTHRESILADSPSDFSRSGDVLSLNSFLTGGNRFGYSLTNAGLRITLPFQKAEYFNIENSAATHLAALKCVCFDDPHLLILLPLRRLEGSNQYVRAGIAQVQHWPTTSQWISDTIYIRRTLDLGQSAQMSKSSLEPLAARLWQPERWIAQSESPSIRKTVKGLGGHHETEPRSNFPHVVNSSVKPLPEFGRSSARKRLQPESGSLGDLKRLRASKAAMPMKSEVDLPLGGAEQEDGKEDLTEDLTEDSEDVKKSPEIVRGLLELDFDI